MSSPSRLKVAVVGAGPAGLFAVERLAKQADVEIDLVERLATPFGLVRYGVAADHQSTKAVARTLARPLDKGQAAFLGGVEVGKAVGLEELRALYDAVILATGAGEDRRLGIPGEALPGVVGSGRFVGWLNSHPDLLARPIPDRPVRHAVVIGAGNVALDVARVLAKTPAELAGSDLDPAIAAGLAAWPLESVTFLIRRGPDEVRFSLLELEELGSLARAAPEVAVENLPPASPDDPAPLTVLRRWLDLPGKEVALRFRFNATPVGFEGDGALRAVRLGDGIALPAELAVTCIGYRSARLGDLPLVEGRLAREEGRLAPGLYVVGWAGRGPSGTIPTNRVESHRAVEVLLAAETPSEKAGRAGLVALLRERGVMPVDWATWQAIDAAERAAAIAPAPRRKQRSAPWQSPLSIGSGSG
jgi:hypothetical protein